ncbi:DegT/DnrJ/EryC1/StrS family aminotransferase [Roseovarius nanhaiticus]|uniref:DegT/DnrJ/EryC1/StrS family aminotransferase n=1 Tax=Roseovarius nanhaiticus TaxID=573024 RepID=UPI0024900E3D|nr:DegT/DnrJ/EryC1/StrS family aminotransferase [Roseovarius nanhaiticus]
MKAGEINIDAHIVHPHMTFRHVMACLDAAPIKLCVMTDESGALLRTIVDGDIRRAFLSGSAMESPVSDLPQNDAVYAGADIDPHDLVALFEANPAISAIVLVDDAKAPVGLVARNTVMSGILLSPPHMGQSESAYVRKAFDDNWIAPAGPNLNAFEEALKTASGRSQALALSSGTAGLHLALCVLGIGRGDAVYVSDLTFAATVQPVLYQDATPVLIDSEPQSWNMSPAALERRLARDAAAGCLPRAVIVVHLYGQSADMAAILAITDRYGIPVIEDAAESLGASYGNRPSGAHGLMSVYSFNGNKIITTSGGGALVSDRADLIDRARMLSTQGRDPAEHYQHSHIAFNYRMSNVLAGIGMGQLELLGDRVARRREIFETYRDALQDIPGLSFQDEPEGSRGNRWLTVISLDPDVIPRHPYQLLRELRSIGVESRPAWKPMHMQPICAGCAFEPHSPTEVVSSRLFLQSLCLPSGSTLSQDQQQRIIDCVRAFTKG